MRLNLGFRLVFSNLKIVRDLNVLKKIIKNNFQNTLFQFMLIFEELITYNTLLKSRSRSSNWSTWGNSQRISGVVLKNGFGSSDERFLPFDEWVKIPSAVFVNSDHHGVRFALNF